MTSRPSNERDGFRRARTVGRAEPASDVTRPRAMLIAAVLAALGAVLALAIVPSKSGLSSPGPLQRPHVEAKLACAACHASDVASPGKACVGCHAAHPSTRPAHRALAAKGELACVSCHVAHGDAQGVTWLADGSALRWGGGRDERVPMTGAVPAGGTTVPLVSTQACARCHGMTNASDPIAACISRASPRVSVCFDEHQRSDVVSIVSGVSGSVGVCKAQHGASRFVAWDAAREAVARAPWVRPLDERRLPWTWVGSGFVAATFGFASMAALRRMRRRSESSAGSGDALASPMLVPHARVRLPQIDTSTCLGCYACVDVCPFDVLQIERYVAVVAKPKDCCGVLLCQQVCPNGSLTIAEGEAREGGPRLDAHLESVDAPGVFLAGDLTGLPLIKNAIRQGAKVVDRIGATLPRRDRSTSDACVDVLVIGAGPAGLSAALRAKELGLRCIVVEQATMAASIRSFPRNKLVFDAPLDIPLEGELWLRESTKEELLAQWTRIARARALQILEHHAVRDVRREGSRFVVKATTPDGERELHGSRIVLAIGRRGSPRSLGADIAPDAAGHVSYSLADARSFAGQRVLVVGLGDAAMEAACAIARQPGADVTISYRGRDFARGKTRNIDEVKKLVARGRMRIAFESRVARVTVDQVRLVTPGGPVDLPCDAVVALIGGVPCWALVEAAGVKLTRAASPDASGDEGSPPT